MNSENLPGRGQDLDVSSESLPINLDYPLPTLLLGKSDLLPLEKGARLVEFYDDEKLHAVSLSPELVASLYSVKETHEALMGICASLTTRTLAYEQVKTGAEGRTNKLKLIVALEALLLVQKGLVCHLNGVKGYEHVSFDFITREECDACFGSWAESDEVSLLLRTFLFRPQGKTMKSLISQIQPKYPVVAWQLSDLLKHRFIGWASEDKKCEYAQYFINILVNYVIARTDLEWPERENYPLLVKSRLRPARVSMSSMRPSEIIGPGYARYWNMNWRGGLILLAFFVGLSFLSYAKGQESKPPERVERSEQL